MRIEYKHRLNNEEAYLRVEQSLRNLKQEYSDQIKNIKTNWTSGNKRMSFSMEIMGFGTSGEIYLQNSQIILDGKLPFLAKPFSGKIEGMIKRELEKVFD